MTRQSLPDNRAGIFERFEADRLVRPDVGGHWNMTNLGAILFAKQLSDFHLLWKAKRFALWLMMVSAGLMQSIIAVMTFSGIVINLNTTIAEITTQGLPSRRAVPHGFGEFRFAGDFG